MQVDIRGAREFERAISRMLREVEHPRTILSHVGQSLVSLIDLEFRESRDPYGRPWAPLTSRSGKPLVDTGRMKNSTTYHATDHFVEVGLGFRYAATHQYGATIRPVRAKKLRFRIGGREVFADEVKIPARPILPTSHLPGEWRDEIRETILAYLAP